MKFKVDYDHGSWCVVDQHGGIWRTCQTKHEADIECRDFNAELQGENGEEEEN